MTQKVPVLKGKTARAVIVNRLAKTGHTTVTAIRTTIEGHVGKISDKRFGVALARATKTFARFDLKLVKSGNVLKLKAA